DPYDPSVATADRYSDPDGQYYQQNPGAYARSRNVVIEDCFIADFVVGVMIDPSGVSHTGSNPSDASEVTIRNCTLHALREGVAVGTLASRRVAVENCTASYMRVFVDGAFYGQRFGPAPKVTNCRITGVRYVFH